MNALPQVLQRWFKEQPQLLTAIFEHISEKRYHRTRRDQYLIAREVEFLIACGSQNLSLWEKLDPGNKNVAVNRARGGSLALGNGVVPDSAAPGSAFDQKLVMYRDMQDATEITPRKLEIEHGSWQAFWQKAQADTSHRYKAVFNLVVVDPMYNYDMDLAEFAQFLWSVIVCVFVCSLSKCAGRDRARSTHHSVLIADWC